MAKASNKSGARGSATVTIQISPEALTFTSALPESVSQLTSLHVCGISPRIFLETIRSPECPIAVIKLGNLRIVDRAEFMAWLRSRAAAPAVVPSSPTGPANDGGPPPEHSADAVLSEIGLERARPAELTPHAEGARRGKRQAEPRRAAGARGGCP